MLIRSVYFLEGMVVEQTGVRVSLLFIKDNWVMDFGVKSLDYI